MTGSCWRLIGAARAAACVRVGEHGAPRAISDNDWPGGWAWGSDGIAVDRTWAHGSAWLDRMSGILSPAVVRVKAARWLGDHAAGSRRRRSARRRSSSMLTSRARSEEHTSELQSRENLVCRLLLEKKK